MSDTKGQLYGDLKKILKVLKSLDEVVGQQGDQLKIYASGSLRFESDGDHIATIYIVDGETPLLSTAELSRHQVTDKSVIGRKRHDAAEAVLRAAGRPMTVPEISESLQSMSYATESSKTKLSNALYTAMNRRPEVFTKNGNRWGLREWGAQHGESA